MPPKEPSAPRPRRTAQKARYHHGDLRRALLEGAFVLVRKHGLTELNLRALARQVGVTHAAPYHHFADREVLIEAMAADAFSELAREMVDALPNVTDAAGRLRTLGRVYIDYGRRRPECLELMFRRRPSSENAALPSAQPGAFELLLHAVRECQTAGVAPTGDAYALALFAWTVVHGFAALWVEGPLPAMPHYAGQFEAMRDMLLKTHAASLLSLADAQRARESG